MTGEPQPPASSAAFVPSPLAPFVGGLLVALLGYLCRVIGVEEDIPALFHVGTCVQLVGLAVTAIGILAIGVSLGIRHSRT